MWVITRMIFELEWHFLCEGRVCDFESSCLGVCEFVVELTWNLGLAEVLWVTADLGIVRVWIFKYTDTHGMGRFVCDTKMCVDRMKYKNIARQWSYRNLIVNILVSL